MTSKELVRNTLRFKNTGRRPHDFPESCGRANDFHHAGIWPSPDSRRSSGVDEWGCVWKNCGCSILGEVERSPLTDWKDFDKLAIPDILAPHRWENVANLRKDAGDKYALCASVSIYERAHFLRGLQNLWADIHENPSELCALVDILADMSVAAIRKYAECGADGIIFCDDWGLQNTLMISPEKWREIWMPRYERVFSAAHENGMDAFMHSCGHIVSILDDLIAAGLDAINMDQQMNMGLDLLSERFRGRITFYNPTDIQAVLPTDDLDLIRRYSREMAAKLGTPTGGFIPKWYCDPAGAGHSEAAVRAMIDEYLAMEDFAPKI
jgi:Uroporphyrinogen-III decarboxylase